MVNKEIIEMGEGVYARLHEGLTNSGFILGDESVLVIDSLRVPSFAKELIRDIKTVTDKPVQYVVDTHSHWDHSWGNEEFLDATIIGHENCYREMIDVEGTNRWRDKVVSANDPWSQEASMVKITPPNLTFEKSMRLYFGGRQIDLRYFGRAHTSGDIFVHLPEDRILFTGDVAQNGGVPYLGDGYLEDWPDTDARLLELPMEQFMAGHGPIGNESDLQDARGFIVDLLASIKSSKEENLIGSDASAVAVQALTHKYAGWRSFERVEEALLEIYENISQTLK